MILMYFVRKRRRFEHFGMPLFRFCGKLATRQKFILHLKLMAGFRLKRLLDYWCNFLLPMIKFIKAPKYNLNLFLLVLFHSLTWNTIIHLKPHQNNIHHDVKFVYFRYTIYMQKDLRWCLLYSIKLRKPH